MSEGRLWGCVPPSTPLPSDGGLEASTTLRTKVYEITATAGPGEAGLLPREGKRHSDSAPRGGKNRQGREDHVLSSWWRKEVRDNLAKTKDGGVLCSQLENSIWLLRSLLHLGGVFSFFSFFLSSHFYFRPSLSVISLPTTCGSRKVIFTVSVFLSLSASLYICHFFISGTVGLVRS